MRLLALALFSAATILSAADATGTWSGTFEFKTDDGQQRQVPVLLILKQDGTKVTGTGGRDEADRHEVMTGKIEGDKMVLDVEAGSAPVHLELTITGDEMTGEATRERDGTKQTAKVSAKRVKQ